MARYMANEPESTFFMDVLKIALGVFIGGLLAALAYTKIIAIGVEYAADQATAAMKRDLQKMKAQEEQSRLQAEQRRQQQEAQNRAAQAAAQQQAFQRQQAEEAQKAFEARREAAWKRTFRPTQICIDDPLTVECIDAANVSRRRFYAQYKD
ncbi:hypothetical protein XA67_22085 [Comamonas thiooxydans]|uniref:hypothetical protein n=1 Tax=Comamonas thiooxydans TaxID=363952 RepID=UPI00062204DC|nr:hypothetical protein [Comamonas thiooxydans]KKI11987.1 hypothetical protein XA67_22085 [Comamonas thiooxydans]